jgi:hypothetical protein
MTETTYFFDGVAYTEGQQADFQASAMRPQGVFPESSLGTLTVTAINGNLTITVGAGEALVQGFYYRNDANKVLAIASNVSGSLRVDRAVLRLDRAANSLLAVIKQGTPGAGAPALTQVAGGTWEFPLYTVNVANAAASIVSADITDQRAYSRWSYMALDTAMATDAEVTSAVAAEATLRTNADTAEQTARAAADTTLQTNINTEQTARINADNALQTNINSEQSARINADVGLQSNINSENVGRATADNALSARISVLETIPMHACALVNGSGGLINYVNVASVTHVSPGHYDINLATPMRNTSAFILGIVEFIGFSFSCVVNNASQLHVICFNAATGTSGDAQFSMMVFD